MSYFMASLVLGFPILLLGESLCVVALFVIFHCDVVVKCEGFIVFSSILISSQCFHAGEWTSFFSPYFTHIGLCHLPCALSAGCSILRLFSRVPFPV